MNMFQLVNTLATIENAKQWEADQEKFVFCIDLLNISAHADYADSVVYRLERKFQILLKRKQWKDLYRQMRFAHSQVNIMSEYGHKARMDTFYALRNFCDAWTPPTIHDTVGSHMFYRRGATYQKLAYAPWQAFTTWMKTH